MSTRFSIVVEREASGVFGAYVDGLPVYAQGGTRGAAVRATCNVLHAFLDANPNAEPNRHHNRFTAKAARQRIRRSPPFEPKESDSLFQRAVDALANFVGWLLAHDKRGTGQSGGSLTANTKALRSRSYSPSAHAEALHRPKSTIEPRCL